MNKFAFLLAYSEPEKAMALYIEHFGDTDDLEKTSSVDKEAFVQEAWKAIQDSYKTDPRMWHGLGGAALGAGAGYMMGGGKGALMGAGIGGLGGYYSSPYLQKYIAHLKSLGYKTPQPSGTQQLPTNYPGYPGTQGSTPNSGLDPNFGFDPNQQYQNQYQIQGIPQRRY